MPLAKRRKAGALSWSEVTGSRVTLARLRVSVLILPWRKPSLAAVKVPMVVMGLSGSVRVRAAPCDLDGDRHGRGRVGPHPERTGAARRMARPNCFAARGMSGRGPRRAGGRGGPPAGGGGGGGERGGGEPLRGRGEASADPRPDHVHQDARGRANYD